MKRSLVLFLLVSIALLAATLYWVNAGTSNTPQAETNSQSQQVATSHPTQTGSATGQQGTAAGQKTPSPSVSFTKQGKVAGTSDTRFDGNVTIAGSVTVQEFLKTLRPVSIVGLGLSGNVINLAGGGSATGNQPQINFNQGGSRILDDGDLHIRTDDNLHLDAPGNVEIQNGLCLGGVCRTSWAGGGGSGTIDGTGTTDAIAKFLGASTLGDSLLTSTSSRVGLGTASPSYRFDVQGGDVNVSGVYRQGSTNVGQSTSCVAGNTFSGFTVSGGIVTAAGSCVAIGGSGTTIQQAYDASSSPELVVDGTNGALTIRDAASPIGANLLEVQNHAGSTTYLAVTSSGISVAGSTTSTGNINSSGGVIQTNGTTRLDNSGNLSNIGTIGASGAVTAGTYNGQTVSSSASFTGTLGVSGNINSSGGVIQTNTTTRIDNSGNLSNIGTINASGAVTAGTYNSQTISSSANFTGTVAVTTLGAAGSTVLCRNGSSQLATCSANPNSVTLQQAYNASTSPELVVDGTRGALTVRDAATPILANLFEVQSNDGGTDYLDVTSSGIDVSGATSVSGNINSVSGDLQTSGATRISSTGAGSLTSLGLASGGITSAGSITGLGANLTGASAVTFTSGGANTLSVDTGGAAGLSIGTSNANAVTFSKSGVATTFQGTTTFNEPLTVGNGAGNDYIGFAAEGTNPSCGAGNYRIWANSADLKLKKCENGSISDLGAGAGGSSTLQQAYDAGATITTGNATDLAITLANTSTDSNLLVDVATGSTSKFAIQDAGADILTVQPSATTKFLFKPGADTASVFVLQDSGGTALLVADSSNSRIYIGNPTADATGTILVLDTKNTSGDPTGVDGAMYYNSDAGKFRCREAGSWTDCIGTGGSGAPTGAQYLVLSADGTLTAERVITAGTNVVVTDAGANSTYTIDVCTTTCALPGDISPAQISADQNDYNPTGLSGASTLRLNSDAIREITGLQGGADGRLIILDNVGSFPIFLRNQSAASSAANRFALPHDFLELIPSQSITLQYDSTSSLWRAIAYNPRTGDLVPWQTVGYSDFGSPSSNSANLDSLVGANWAGTSASCAKGTGTALRVGVVTCTTGSTAAGHAGYTTGDSAMLFGGGAVYFRADLQIPTLSDDTDDFLVYAGFTDSTSAEPTDGCYFRYNDNQASGTWQGVCRNNTAEASTSGTTVVAGTWYKLEIFVNAAGTNVKFFVNGAQIGTDVTTDIPTATNREFGINPVNIRKTLGTTPRTLTVDLYETLINYSALR